MKSNYQSPSYAGCYNNTRSRMQLSWPRSFFSAQDYVRKGQISGGWGERERSEIDRLISAAAAITDSGGGKREDEPGNMLHQLRSVLLGRRRRRGRADAGDRAQPTQFPIQPACPGIACKRASLSSPEM